MSHSKQSITMTSITLKYISHRGNTETETKGFLLLKRKIKRTMQVTDLEMEEG